MNDQYDIGYARGLREGNVDGGEQDFAFKSADYVDGYWDGFRVGRKARVIYPQPTYDAAEIGANRDIDRRFMNDSMDALRRLVCK
jgi:hypothetical protein